jgi:hypothetical protein
MLAAKFHGIGKSMLKDQTAPVPHRSKPSDAVVWLQRAFDIVDQLEDTTINGISQLKVSCIWDFSRNHDYLVFPPP